MHVKRQNKINESQKETRQMAIKFYSVPEKRQTVAVLSNCKYDVLNKIDKIMRETGFCFSPNGDKEYNRYLMPDTFRIVLNCDARDEYNVEEGKNRAKEKLMKNYHRSMNKRLNMFKKNFQQLATVMETKGI